MQNEELATMCNALGDPTRARILIFLLGCCCPVAVEEGGDVTMTGGATAGQVCCHLTGGDKITSTVSFHLKELRNAGIITMEKRGKYMVCGVNREALAKLATFFGDAVKGSACCKGDT